VETWGTARKYLLKIIKVLCKHQLEKNVDIFMGIITEGVTTKNVVY